ncbi:MAG: hypothetical protein Faunusvirus2_55 [Faunusvirus sp.]|uniref:Uncharacterized protein n=1 Tax=Faunusvirus sp. TaxID=2487766 RepID=A0A3G4ZW27_9VIRU|nr:MAG: hypothetical protein Faunusvirus2_55 [Faunusvirus sp.]
MSETPSQTDEQTNSIQLIINNTLYGIYDAVSHQNISDNPAALTDKHAYNNYHNLFMSLRPNHLTVKHDFESEFYNKNKTQLLHDVQYINLSAIGKKIYMDYMNIILSSIPKYDKKFSYSMLSIYFHKLFMPIFYRWNYMNIYKYGNDITAFNSLFDEFKINYNKCQTKYHEYISFTNRMKCDNIDQFRKIVEFVRDLTAQYIKDDILARKIAHDMKKAKQQSSIKTK